MSEKFLFSFLILLLSVEVIAQKELRLYEKAEVALMDHRYSEALSLYREVQKIDPVYEDIDYKTTFLALLLPEGDDSSLDLFRSFESSYGDSDDHYYYWLGQVYIRRYEIDKAVAAFEKFEQKLNYSGSQDQESEQLISYSKKLKEFFNNPGTYEIHQLDAPINGTSTELSPVFFEAEDELLFASDREGEGLTPYSIYYAKQTEYGWSQPEAVVNLGQFTRENANVEVVNSDGKLFLFREDKGGDLFYSKLSGDTWIVPVEFDARISNNHLASHFFINEHEDRIIFASDEDEDGLDIYQSFRDPEDGKWTKPGTFDLSINSPYDEDSPYLSPDETKLYFSSKRPGGIGGFDIYVSKLDPTNYSWSSPVNLGWPINSPNDEIHFKMNEDQTSGYFVSDRLHSKGSSDIYFFWEVQQVQITGKIFDETTGAALKNAEIRFHPSQYLDEYFVSNIDATGNYSTQIISDEVFSVEIILDGVIIFKDRFEIHDTSGEPTTYFKDFSVNY